MRLNDSRAKFRWAHQHFNVLKNDIAVFLEPKPYRVVVERPSDKTYVVRLDNAPGIPAEDWALRVGDCVHAMRCALDFIAWKLAGSRAGDRQTQFPIFDTEAGWNANHERRVGRMKPQAQALLKVGQPFNAPDPALSGLTGIRVLNDADKHRLLTVVAAMPLQFSATWARAGMPAEPTAMSIPRGTVLSGNAVIATFEFPDPTPEMQMLTYLAPDIAFGKGLLDSTTPVQVVGSLTAMLSEVEAIIDVFEGRPDLFP